jgi:hypothetical protein
MHKTLVQVKLQSCYEDQAAGRWLHQLQRTRDSTGQQEYVFCVLTSLCRQLSISFCFVDLLFWTLYYIILYYIILYYIILYIYCHLSLLISFFRRQEKPLQVFPIRVLIWLNLLQDQIFKSRRRPLFPMARRVVVQDLPNEDFNFSIKYTSLQIFCFILVIWSWHVTFFCLEQFAVQHRLPNNIHNNNRSDNNRKHNRFEILAF